MFGNIEDELWRSSIRAQRNSTLRLSEIEKTLHKKRWYKSAKCNGTVFFLSINKACLQWTRMYHKLERNRTGMCLMSWTLDRNNSSKKRKRDYFSVLGRFVKDCSFANRCLSFDVVRSLFDIDRLAPGKWWLPVTTPGAETIQFPFAAHFFLPQCLTNSSSGQVPSTERRVLWKKIVCWFVCLFVSSQRNIFFSCSKNFQGGFFRGAHHESVVYSAWNPVVMTTKNWVWPSLGPFFRTTTFRTWFHAVSSNRTLNPLNSSLLGQE